MNKNRRIGWYLFSLGILILLGITFQSFILENFVRPVAILLWIFWRVLLSVDQIVYWTALIFIAAFAALLGLSQTTITYEREAGPQGNTILKNVSYWRTMILLTNDEAENPNQLKRDLALTLTQIYALQKAETSNYEVFNGLKTGAIPLPEPIHAFLFPPDPSSAGNSWFRALKKLPHTLSHWYRRKTGRETAEYHRAIAEVVTYMESLMENNNEQ